MLEADALVDRHRLRQEVGAPRPPPDRGRLSPWIRLLSWALLAGGWAVVGFPLAAVPAIVVFERLVVPGLVRPRRHLGRLTAWDPPPSFVLSPESPPSRGRLP